VAEDQTPATRRDRTRLILALVFAALIVAFALANLDEVEVNWIIGSGSTPLIIVIVVSFLLGGLTGVLASRARRTEKK
jgi:uncharacterized integral membrane protein